MFDMFDYIEMFYNPISRNGSDDGLSPIEFKGSLFFSNSVSRKLGAIQPKGERATSPQLVPFKLHRLRQQHLGAACGICGQTRCRQSRLGASVQRPWNRPRRGDRMCLL